MPRRCTASARPAGCSERARAGCGRGCGHRSEGDRKLPVVPTRKPTANRGGRPPHCILHARGRIDRSERMAARSATALHRGFIDGMGFAMSLRARRICRGPVSTPPTRHGSGLPPRILMPIHNTPPAPPRPSPLSAHFHSVALRLSHAARAIRCPAVTTSVLVRGADSRSASLHLRHGPAGVARSTAHAVAVHRDQ